MNPFPIIKYLGTALPLGANTYTLFSTVATNVSNNTSCGGMPENFFGISGLHRLLISLVNSQAGTLKGYRSSDRGVTWTQVYTQSVAIFAVGTSTPYDFLVEEFRDFKLDWLNGGVDQTSFIVDMALADSRNPIV